MSEDLELLAAWRAGDQRAGEQLVGHHYDAVLRFFRTKAGDEADDLVQRTFLRCVEPKSTFRGDSSFRAFVFGVARNVLFENIRARTRDRKVDPDFGVSSILDLNPRASTVIIEQAEQRMLVNALQRLPLELQLTLELHYWEELPVEEVASALGIPAGTVKSRLFRGRELLRAQLEREPQTAARDSATALLQSWTAGVPAASAAARTVRESDLS